MNLIVAFLMLIIPDREIVIERQPTIIHAEVTAYNAVKSQTDDSPDIVASGKNAKVGMAACPTWLEFGTIIEVSNKRWVCEDRMAKRYRDGHYFDLLVETHEEAKQFGRQKLLAKIYD